MKKNNRKQKQPAPLSRQPGVRLSLGMIVKNEEERLGSCLESMAGIADEIVIVDTGSTDGTVGIARRFGARVIEFPWNGSFSDARNESIRHCTGDWVIFLDADERLDRPTAPLLRKILNDPAVMAYELTVVSRVSDDRKNTGFSHGYNPRLFRRRDDVRFQYRVHESILPAVRRAGGNVGRAAVTILHIGYDVSSEVLQKKMLRNIDALRLDALDFPEDVFVAEKLAQTEMVLRYQPGYEVKAEAALKRFISLLDQGAGGERTPMKRSNALNLLSELYLWNKRLDEAENCAQQSLTVSPMQYQAHSLLARIYDEQGRYDQALSETGELLGLCKTHPPFQSKVEGDCNVLEEDVLYQQGMIYKRQGRETGAVCQALEATLRINAKHRDTQSELALIYAREEKIGDVIRVLRTIGRTEKEHAGLVYLRGKALSKAGDIEGAIDDLWAAFSNGIRTDDLIFLLVRLLNEQKKECDAIPLYKEYLSRHERADDARMLLLQLYVRMEMHKEAARFAADSLGVIDSEEVKGEFLRIAAILKPYAQTCV